MNLQLNFDLRVSGAGPIDPAWRAYASRSENTPANFENRVP